MKFFFNIILIIAPIFGFAQNINRPIPPTLPGYEFVLNDSSFQEQYLLTPIFIPPLNAPVQPVIMILDSMGYLLWYKSQLGVFFTDFKYHRNQKIFTVIRGQNFNVIDTNFQKIDSLSPINGFTNDNHEFNVLRNGNFILSGKSDSIVDYSAHNFSGVQGGKQTHLVGFTIQEFDSNHNLLFEWNSNDYLDPLESYDNVYGYDSTAFDYCHGNSIEKDYDGNYLVSMRHFNAILKINKNDGSVIWKLGGKNNDFTFLNDIGFSGQHDCRRLSNGNISLFDNANSATTPRVSRPKVYQLDTISMTATKVWDYTTPTPYFARAMGNFQVKANNFKTIGYGFNYRPNPSLVVLDSQNNVISELYLRDSVVSYRAVTYDIPINWDRPKVTCSYSNNNLTLYAPAGKSDYIWSNGAITSSIVVSNPGEYQVWVNKGIGMIGSLPLKVTNVNQYCNSTDIEELSLKRERKVISIVDLLGRKIETPKINQIYIYQFSDGSVEKRILKF